MAYHWSIHQLTEYYDTVISQEDEAVAVRVALERTVEALGAEFGGVTCDSTVLACVGLGRAHPPDGALEGVCNGADTLELPRLGLLHAVSAPLDAVAGHLVLARADEEFVSEECQLLQGMANGLGLALRSLRILKTEQIVRAELETEAAERLRLLNELSQRERLLESLLTIQRAISHREPLQRVLDAVTSGAAGLLGGNPVVALVLAENGMTHRRIVSATRPVGAKDAEGLVLEVAAASVEADLPIAQASADGVGTAIAAPVHIEGIASGSLVALTPATTEPPDRAGRELLAAFAEHASLAMTDARTVELMREAHLDPLTGLPNRALFLDALTQSMHRATRTDTEISVLFVDLDRFKEVNDSLGHAAGDQLLTAVADRIRGCVRADDTAARLGGDEFAVLLERTSGLETGRDVAQRIIQSLGTPVPLEGHEVFPFASIGIASSRQGPPSADIVLRNADAAMYTAKRTGSRTPVEYDPSMHADSVRKLELRSDLSLALDRQEFRLEYQPMIKLATGAAVAVEALARWDHPKYGSVPPNIFIPIAESGGGIVEIGEWVLQEACTQAALWRATSAPELTLSVNVSLRQLDEPGFAARVSAILAEAMLPPAALTLEITESALMRDPEMTMARLAPLRQAGVRVGIDDFGTGYSSLAWLQHCPADQLKIDKTFVDTIESSAEGAAIVRTVVELARILHLETVAEGITTTRQQRMLRGLSCDLGQGFAFARPLAASAIPAYFAVRSATASGLGGAERDFAG